MAEAFSDTSFLRNLAFDELAFAFGVGPTEAPPQSFTGSHDAAGGDTKHKPGIQAMQYRHTPRQQLDMREQKPPTERKPVNNKLGTFHAKPRTRGPKPLK